MNIPQLPTSPLLDLEKKDISEAFREFLDLLINVLQTNASNEGLVAPSQSTANITVIQNNQLENSSYTTAGGTLIYDSSTDQLKVAILSAGIPTFHVVTVV